MSQLRGEAAILVGPGRLEVEEVPVRELADGEVLVRNTVGAICGSDVHRVRAESPFFRDMNDHPFPCPPGYPGHEGLGEVLESRSPKFRPGEIVLTVPNHAYMASFAKYQTISDQFLLHVPSDGSPMHYLMAQQLGTVVYALKKFWPEPTPGRTAAVVGVGSAGMLFVQLLKHRGFEHVVAVDLDAGRLALARELGADETVLVPDQSLAEFGVDLAIEAAGTDSAREYAMEMVGLRGKLGFFGMPEAYGLEVPYAALFGKQITLTTAVGAQLEPDLASFRESLGLIVADEIAVKDHITHTFDLKRIGEAFELAHSRADGVVKVGITYE
ncbi:zinc-binding dehydrogenase [Allokutzneria sp. A3M-2-11 16]|uniref:zinc-binding dehydrogenase n=1 Tax=Allokutzneria sp. A3M-2-11 16 TaxID=2962043 RepID=UPI0020B86BBD|nr:zinc-binding dehydrogenase [Allokutzneria sp. A3M-2-11 16]MCP3803141.1 zinc-binding dehydrogenase [Allokutzneria sp. A3M-2-11 16]